MAQVINLTYCGMEGTGPTVSAAKKDAARKLEHAVTGNWTPFVMAHKGYTAFVFRSIVGGDYQWGYGFIQDGSESKDLYTFPNYLTREAAIEGAAYHLAQVGNTYAGIEPWLPKNKQNDLDGYFEWQRAYAEGKAEGLNDPACRDRADRSLNDYRSR